MIDIEAFILEREKSLFSNIIDSNYAKIRSNFDNVNCLVIGGSGSIGSHFCNLLLSFGVNLDIIDINENKLADYIRDIRNSKYLKKNQKINTFCFSANYINVNKYFEIKNSYKYVFNFSALKHVRSERDPFTLKNLIETNIINPVDIGYLCNKYEIKNYFVISTDKAASPVNMMGCSKRLMEIFLTNSKIKTKINFARFANVLFSSGSLPSSYFQRLTKNEPLVAPIDIKRYFITHEESSQICLLSSLLGDNKDIAIPNNKLLKPITFLNLCKRFLEFNKLRPVELYDINELNRFLPDKNEYPILNIDSNTTGEKKIEIFSTNDDQYVNNISNIIDFIKNNEISHSYEGFKSDFSKIFNSNAGKDEYVKLFIKYSPSFKHKELNKNLDESI
jgi:FlaA1/EpsC-like NDP-sugar epimerase